MNRLCPRFLSLFAALCLALLWLDSPGAVAADGNRSEVRLLEPGIGERTVLRWKPEAGIPVRVRMVMHMQMSMAFDGQKLPGAELPGFAFNIVVTADNPNELGHFPVRSVYEKVELVGETEPMIRDALLQALRPLEGAEMQFVIDDRGLLQSMDLRNFAPQVLEMLGGERALRQMIESLADPMPEEAVGVGAKWEVKQIMRAPNAPVIESVVEYELLSRDGDQLNLKITSTQTGKEQDFDVGVPGAQAKLNSASGSYHGTAFVRLSRLVPVNATNEGQMEFSFTITERGRTQRMDQTIRMKVTIEELDAAGRRPIDPSSAG